jgi:hypothetical protein
MNTDQPLKPDFIESEPSRRWYHPLSAGLMIAFDFGGTIGDIEGMAFTVLLPFVILSIFALVCVSVTWVQYHYEHDSRRQAWIKGAFAGFLCAIPFPIFGTAFGTFLLIKSGMSKPLQKGS